MILGRVRSARQSGIPGGGDYPIPLSVSSEYLDLIQYIQHELEIGHSNQD